MSHLAKYESLVPSLALICAAVDEERQSVGLASLRRALACLYRMGFHGRATVLFRALASTTLNEMGFKAGDDRVRKVARYEPGVCDLRNIEFEGRGGTDFTPLLMEAEKHRPDIAVVLTDHDGPARFRPRWPVSGRCRRLIRLPFPHLGAKSS